MKMQKTNSPDKVFEVEYKESDIEELKSLGVPNDELPKVGIKKNTGVQDLSQHLPRQK
jgi:hypothetical protein